MFRTTERLCPNVLKQQLSRARLFATVVGVDGHCQHLTFKDIENVSNRAAWFLAQNLQSDKFFYMGPNDIRYFVWVLGAMKTSKCVVFPSPGNSIPANIGLFQKVGATSLLYSPEVTTMLSPLLEATEATIKPLVTPGYGELLGSEAVQPYPFQGTFDELQETPFMGLHTSGTSGHPKPVYWNHLAASTLPSFLDPEIQAMGPKGPNVLRELLHNSIILVLFPLFHFGGIGPTLASLHCMNTLVFPAPGTRPTPTNVTAIYTAGFMRPMISEAMVDHAPGLEALSQLEHVGYAGGTVNATRGKELAKHIRHFFSIMAITEGGASDLISCRDSNAFFHTHPHLQTEYRTSDLFSPVEGESNWWIYRGRTDNWVRLANGLKIDLTDIEDTISSHSDIHRALANKGVPKIARIPKGLVLFTTQKKPFTRASKGTIQQIEELYAAGEEELLTGGLSPLESSKPHDLIPLLEAIFSQTLDDKNSNIDANENLLSRGIDSLGVSVVLARLKAFLQKHNIGNDNLHLIRNKLIYTELTINRMAKALSAVLSDSETTVENTSQTQQKALDQLLETYENQLITLEGGDVISIDQSTQLEEIIVLTGSTGSLGSYILSTLLTRSNVRKVFCLNRSPDAAERQQASFRSRGLPDLPVDDKRVVFLHTTLSEPKLGLSDDEYAVLINEATSIVHNAFSVNFLLSIESFEPQFQALINLLKLAANGQKKPAMLFMSYVRRNPLLSKDQATDILRQGYAQAKYLCERLLETYALTAKGKTAILRVGQVCGPLSGTGIWNVWEWAPSLVLSSKFLGIAPRSIGSLGIDWVPVDKLGSIVSELLFTTSIRDSDHFAVYNVVSHITTLWEELLPVLQKVALETVPAEEWIRRLEQSEEGAGGYLIDQNPAIKLTDFYKQTMLRDRTPVRIKMDNLLRASETATTLPPIKGEHLTR
ncbi:hypothetical protein F4810DRAFT_717670 [Camillea tinctor]|nr:hypothetical protein F4810DRAFT_717670 [Camillea tinctor]